VPRYKEFNTDALYSKALDDTEVKQYLPDPVGEEKKRTVGRNYLFTVSIPTSRPHPLQLYYLFR
jgi:hypothetical protein